MNANDWIQLADLFSVAVVVVTTIWVMQHQLTKAHLLLRLGLALVCAGSILEFYCALQVDPGKYGTSLVSLVENVGQAAVYVWAATSKRLWRIMDRISRMTPGEPL